MHSCFFMQARNHFQPALKDPGFASRKMWRQGFQLVPNGGDLQQCEWKRPSLRSSSSRCGSWGSRLLMAVLKCWSEGVSGGLVELLLLTGLLPALVLKFTLEEEEKGDRV